MLTLVQIELYKIFKKWRTYIGFIAIAILVAVIQTAISYEGSRALNSATRGLQNSFVFVGNLLNGYFVSNLILNSLYVHIPFLITLVAGDLMAGEASAGTYRMLITRPVTRFSIVTAKFIAGIIYTAILILWLAALSLGLGTILFGSGELISIQSNAIVVFASNDVLWRFLLAYSFSIVSMSVVTVLAFFLSSLVENSIGPIITTMAIIIIFIIISHIDVSVFQTIKPYLFTNYMDGWKSFFSKPLDYSSVWNSLLVLGIHIVGLYGLTLFLFSRKDILT
ncbi:MAG: ABC transporter permease subunit [Ignavibacteriaceae bacterium]